MQSRRTSPLDPAHCVCAALRKASRAITQMYDTALRPSGIRSTQFNILSAIHASGESNISQLAELLLIDQTTLTRSLGLLENEGLLRPVAKDDARIKAFRLTPKGKTTLKAASVLWKHSQAAMLKALGAHQWQSGQQFLQTVIQTARS